MAVEMMSENGGKIMVVRVSEKLSREDYERFVPEVERLIQQHGTIDLLFEMHDFHGWELSAMWEDTKFGYRHFHDIGHLAIVGEKRWQKNMTMLCKPFTKAEVRYFDQSESQQAREWLHIEPAHA